MKGKSRMFKKLESYLKTKQEQIKKQEELKKAQTYFNLIKAGGAFIKFLQEDLKRQENGMNRHARRRMEHDLNEKGILSEELVQYYQMKIDYTLQNIAQRLKPQNVQKTNPNVQVSNTKPPDAK